VSVPVVGLGAGGHAKVVIEILQADRQYEVIGLLDPNRDIHGKSVLGIPVLGDDGHLPILKARGVEHFFVGLGSTSDLKPRRRLYEFALSQGMKPVSAIHPRAVISPSATLGLGATVMSVATINAAAQLGENVIVNTGAIVEHDCIVGNHVHIATGARLASTVHVGDTTHIGIGAVIRQLITIGSGVLVAAGAVVVDDVPDNVTVAGVPARLLKRNENHD